MLNPFSKQTKALFEIWECWECGQNGTATGGLDGHHILGRESDSPFNFAPLCRKCHDKVTHKQEEHQRLFLKTAMHLKCIRYEPKEKDWDFIKKNLTEIYSQDLQVWLKPRQESKKQS